MIGSHITEFYAENVKRLRVVRITPADGGGLVEISGANGSGKSSVLDAIAWALTGTRGVDPEPIRDGETSATVRLTLGEVTITRRFTAGGSTLTIESAEGARFPSPQKMLDELLGAAVLAFDPLEFDRMKPADQLAEVQKVAPLPAEVEDWRDEIRMAYAERTDVNRNAKALTARLDAMPKAGPETVPTVSVDRALAELTAAIETNRATEERSRAVVAKNDDAKRHREEAKNLRERAAELVRGAELREAQAAKLEAEVLDMPTVGTLIDVAELEARVQDARQFEKDTEAARARAIVEAELLDAEGRADYLTRRIAERESLIRQAIAAAAMPVAGLTYGEDGLEFNGHPLQQASGAERLRVALGLAMAAAPAIRVVRIKDGSLLDTKSLAIVAEMAAERGYQVWIERVDTTGRVGVVMQDGEVAAVNGQGARNAEG